MAYYPTVATVVSRAARQLGLVQADIADPFTSVDPNILQMLALLSQLGQDLVTEYEWPHLVVKDYTFTTSNGVASYDLPADFDRHVDQSQWNRSTSLPLVPVGPQGWQALKTLNSASAVQFYFRTEGNVLLLHPTPAGAYAVALEYVRRTWVIPDGGGLSDGMDAPSEFDDTLQFDARLLVHGLKWKFRTHKRLDAEAEWAEYDKALNAAKSATPAPVLNMSGGPASNTGYAGAWRLPPTGWGT